jgi:predicted metal-dependent phosphoesterase TrpH
MVIKVDFHSHTIYSKDSLTMPADLVKFARHRGLDRIVITDHNSISGALIAQQLDPDLVIVGEEIKTTQGEILAAYVKEAIPAGVTPFETIERLRDQGAFISVSHPFDLRSGAWLEEDLLEITPLVDAIEVFNARCMKPGANQSATRFAQTHNIPGTAGSDAHTLFEIGAAYIEFPEFKNPGELRKVIRQGRVRGKLSPFWVHFFSRYARFKKRVAV